MEFRVQGLSVEDPNFKTCPVPRHLTHRHIALPGHVVHHEPHQPPAPPVVVLAHHDDAGMGPPQGILFGRVVRLELALESLRCRVSTPRV